MLVGVDATNKTGCCSATTTVLYNNYGVLWGTVKFCERLVFQIVERGVYLRP